MNTTTRERPARNGVDVPTLFATPDVVRDAPEAARFQFRATRGREQERATVMAPALWEFGRPFPLHSQVMTVWPPLALHRPSSRGWMSTKEV
jgi:hypothetical protein